jgi:hypothetical protein
VNRSDAIPSNSCSFLASLHYSYFRVSHTVTLMKDGDGNDENLSRTSRADCKPKCTISGSRCTEAAYGIRCEASWLDRVTTITPSSGMIRGAQTLPRQVHMGAVGTELVTATKDYIRFRIAGQLLAVFASQLILLHSPPFWRILAVVSAVMRMYELVVP